MNRLNAITQHFRRYGELPVGHRIELKGDSEGGAPAAYHEMVELEVSGRDRDPEPRWVKARGHFSAGHKLLTPS